MLRFRSLWVLAVPFLIVAGVAGSYPLRWLSVLIASLILLTAFLVEAEVYYGERKKKKEFVQIGKSEFQRLTDLVKLAKKGKTAQNLIENKIVEIYALAEEKSLQDIRKSPNRALEVLRSEGDFLQNLEKALDFIEEDLKRIRGEFE
ncbi:hypothetical protein PAP_00445 [Palaeococcus pacificus DY20341]|uniref:Uncharacterized protein n=1 Tax=Palaeococcus pacificus DY20341 TaxID=1343739 RepID=A0A075LR09_9EURY|nr:hypothetical protein [Palaeococcus pacificus]AIF68536.1 hypothetical protein PAP_00445 [Palaeococcus pacificus DY20341]